MSEPWLLFRYRAINEFLWQELELAQLYCAAPGALNDPFDCRVHWNRSFDRALANNLDDERRSKLIRIGDQFRKRDPAFEIGVCCFSIKLDDHLMWSHYADSHRGVCLLYEFPRDYLLERYQPNERGDLFLVGGSPVYYGDDTFHDWLVGGDLDRPFAGEYAENTVARLFTSKARCWAHEEEWRIVTSKPGRLQFEPNFLKQVTFGLGTSAEHRRLVVRMAKRANPAVTLSEVRRSASKDFGFEFPDVEV